MPNTPKQKGQKGVFHRVTLWSGLALAMSAVSMVLNSVSFFSVSWGKCYPLTYNPEVPYHYGLWKRCSDNLIAPDCVELLGWNIQWYQVLQGFAMAGFLCSNLAVLLLVLALFVRKCGRSDKMKSLFLWVVVVSFVSAGSNAIAMTLFGVKFDDSFMSPRSSQHASLEYGFFLLIGCVLLMVATGILMLVEACFYMGAKLMDL